MKKQFLTYAVSYTEIFKDFKYFDIVSQFVEDNKRFCIKTYRKIDSFLFLILSIIFSFYFILVSSLMHMFEPLNSTMFVLFNLCLVLLFKNDIFFNVRNAIVLSKNMSFLDKAMFISNKRYHLIAKKLFNTKFLLANIISADISYYISSSSQFIFIFLNSLILYFLMMYFYKEEINLKNVEKGKTYLSLEDIQKYYGLKD